MPNTAQQDELVSAACAAIIGRLNDRRADVSRSIQHLLAAEIEPLRGDPHLIELLGASVEGNVDAIFRALQYEIPLDRVEPPTAALEYARRLAQRGVPANALVRAYRLGQKALLDIIIQAIRGSDIDVGLRFDVVERMQSVTFRYIDWISIQVVETYEEERDHWLENRNTVRALRVRELLESDDIDVDALTAAIRYPLRRTHVAVVMWYSEEGSAGTELTRLERFLRDIGHALGVKEKPLFVAADRVTGWGWIPFRDSSAINLVSDLNRFVSGRQDAPRLAIGTPLKGPAGFRRSHHQALQARAVALAAGAHAGRVTAAGDPGLSTVALLGQDLAEAKIWVHETLGPLATNTDNDARLRETLRVFLREGSSYKAASDELNLHFNSVKYRVQRAEERRGRPIAGDRLDVELALLMCHWLGAAVLSAEHS
ncbi:PucR family transcriptional regulator [Skermania sp. ID1734]|uniref:PucR family transcriptional regulator n=1 Tax=Skermania sp. ID1734 TaxID=2597516 RepID=UPI00117C9DCC|nr:helix-turn-helix domain-containing protein [Skermania sp. ID1734]TSD93672.1 PucR family transcriptional regulator [Skermania sp. ID1734]